MLRLPPIPLQILTQAATVTLFQKWMLGLCGSQAKPTLTSSLRLIKYQLEFVFLHSSCSIITNYVLQKSRLCFIREKHTLYFHCPALAESLNVKTIQWRVLAALSDYCSVTQLCTTYIAAVLTLECYCLAGCFRPPSMAISILHGHVNQLQSIRWVAVN